jgi:hypothetical protein
MKNDFINIYKAIEPKEQDAFLQYIQCFYGNQKAVIGIFEKAINTLDSDEDLEETLAVSINTSRKNILNAFSDLKKWLLEFLAIQEVKHNTVESKFLTLEMLRKRNLYEVFQQKSKHLKQDLNTNKSPDMWHLLWHMRLSHINYFNTPHDKLQEYQDEMSQLMSELDSFYAATKLKYSAELFSRSTVLQDKYEIYLLDDIFLLLENNHSLHFIVGDLYLPILQLTRDQSLIAYSKLKDFLTQRIEHEPIERQAIILYLLNFNISRIRSGENEYIQECFDLYKIGLSQSLFIATGHFPTESFMNIVNFGCRLKEYTWLQGFVNQWSPYLLSSEMDDVKNFSLARIYFEEKSFELSLELLQRVTFKNFLINLNSRILLVRAFFEQKAEKYLILDHCNALYLYAYRSKVIGLKLKKDILNFVKVFRLIVNEKSTKKSLFKELDKKQKEIMCYDWLKSKIDERMS